MPNPKLDRDDPEQFMEWMTLLSAPRVLSEPEVARLMELHGAFSDREDPDAVLNRKLDG